MDYLLSRRARPKGNTFNHVNKIPLEEILVKDSTYKGIGRLKKRLFANNLLSNKCQLCGLENEWHGKPIVLRLDHINGTNNDHRIENLRMLCPNCDSQTPTFAGRNKKHSPLKKKYCTGCTTEIPRATVSGLCMSCAQQLRQSKVIRPDKNSLIKEVAESTYVAVCKKYGVSDNTIRNWINR